MCGLGAREEGGKGGDYVRGPPRVTEGGRGWWPEGVDVRSEKGEVRGRWGSEGQGKQGPI